MRRARLKLNPKKCVFGVTKGKILGCLISAKRIEVNLDKIRLSGKWRSQKQKKYIQKLNSRVAALNIFISRSAEQSLPFFKALKGKGKIEWGPDQSKAFAELKEYIEKMVILSPPLLSEPLFLYVAASKAAVSVALVREVDGEKGKYQIPIYFVSEALSGSKLLYSELEKIAYAVLMATRELMHYFEAHKVTVLTDQPLNDLFINKDASSRIAKWAKELSEHTIDFGKKVGDQVASFGGFCRGLDLTKQHRWRGGIGTYVGDQVRRSLGAQRRRDCSPHYFTGGRQVEIRDKARLFRSIRQVHQQYH
jgi:hypothetical protein